MNNKSKKIVAGAIAASFLVGAGFIGLHSQAMAADTGDTANAKTQIGKGGMERGKFGGPGRAIGFAGGNLVKQTATLLGVEESAVTDELKQGKTLAQIAESKGLALDAYVQKLVDAQTKAIDEQVTAGKLKQEQADKLKSGLADRLKKEVSNSGFGKKGFSVGGAVYDKMQHGPGFGFAGGNLVKETAVLLGVEESAVTDELKQGKTLAQIAESKGLALDAFVQKLVDAQTKAIDEQVAAGKLDQAKADKLKSGLAEMLKKRVQSQGGMERGNGFGGPGFAVGGSLVKETAALLGVEESAVMDELKQGKTLAQIAEAKGLALDAYVQKLVDAQTKAIDEQVAAGKLDQAQADKIKSGLAEVIKKKVENTLRDGGQGKRHEAWAAPDALAQKLGITKEELMKELQAGKSVADLAKEKGITLDMPDFKMKDGRNGHKGQNGNQQQAASSATATE